MHFLDNTGRHHEYAGYPKPASAPGLKMNRTIKTCSAVCTFLFFFSYGTDVFPAGEPGLSRQVHSTDRQCRELALATLDMPAPERQENINRLIGCLEHEYYYELHKGASKYALSRIGDAALPGLVQALNHEDYRVIEGAAAVLGMMGADARKAGPALKDLLRSASVPRGVRKYEVAKALGRIGETDFLIMALKGEEPGVSRFNASHGLQGAGPQAAKAIPVLLEMLHSDNAPDQALAAETLGAIGKAAQAAVPRLGTLTESRYNFVRRAAGEALLNIGTPDAIQAAGNYKLKKDVSDVFYKAMSVFVWLPWLAVIVGLLLAAITYMTARKRTRKSAMIKTLYFPAALWLVYAAWEYHAGIQGANIRIDLLVIYPLLVAATVTGLVLWAIGIRMNKKH